ncbi:hypothetical protein [Pelistega suis]|uniref:hypothetical protein n=1 Tax=Pelistega suis TaxID=1631957 RepID=UPI00211C8520|nr:hypothetical protein [Pelistega suis]MCQ9328682.1 hypothetical protein [Pelistega suis]
MNKERLLKYLNNMNTALDYIIQDTEGKEFQEFIQDRVSRQAVQLNIQPQSMRFLLSRK